MDYKEYTEKLLREIIQNGEIPAYESEDERVENLVDAVGYLAYEYGRTADQVKQIIAAAKMILLQEPSFR